jgi:hypothetical protein
MYVLPTLLKSPLRLTCCVKVYFNLCANNIQLYAIYLLFIISLSHPFLLILISTYVCFPRGFICASCSSQHRLYHTYYYCSILHHQVPSMRSGAESLFGGDGFYRISAPPTHYPHPAKSTIPHSEKILCGHYYSSYLPLLEFVVFSHYGGLLLPLFTFFSLFSSVSLFVFSFFPLFVFYFLPSFSSTISSLCFLLHSFSLFCLS